MGETLMNNFRQLAGFPLVTLRSIPITKLNYELFKNLSLAENQAKE
jgi:hypothetical protein